MFFRSARHAAAILLLALWFPATAAALDVPRPSGYVNDDADILSASTELRLDRALAEFERSDSTQIAVLTIPSLEGEVLEEYSLRVAEKWGIGQKEHDNGALLLVAKAERKIRIEVGYGLEGRLTDLLAGRIIDHEIAPRFKQGDYDGGILAGVAAMMDAVRGEYQGSGRTTSRKKQRSPWGTLLLLLFLGPGMMFLRSPRARRRHGGFWFGGPFGGGGFGGGGFSGGGGGFGGGGSSGGW